ncbi:hypothetical protein [Vulcanisaeta distributa]|nr:hypothetical protein [Vulcanisaeta distributa]
MGNPRVRGRIGHIWVISHGGKGEVEIKGEGEDKGRGEEDNHDCAGQYGL